MGKQLPNVYIIAGPNGAGKTTFAKRFLPDYAHCPNFVNADLIAQGLSPFDPALAAIQAGRVLLEQIHSLAEKKIDFAFETTLSGKTHFTFLEDLKKKGYQLHLFFLWIPSVELALGRVRERVLRGGHDVPVIDVTRRFQRSIYNFFRIYKPLLDSWMIFDNSTPTPSLIAKEERDKLTVVDAVLYDKIIIDKKSESDEIKN